MRRLVACFVRRTPRRSIVAVRLRPGARAGWCGISHDLRVSGNLKGGSPWLLCVALACGLTMPVVAHHSPAAFDRTKQVTLIGTVKEFRWQNPHTWIEVLVPNDKGEEVLWGIELTSPTYLVRAGWKSNTIRPGDKVTVVGNPVRSGEPSAIFVSLTLDDGRTLTERPARLGGANASGRE
jgi:hypothetical protein